METLTFEQAVDKGVNGNQDLLIKDYITVFGDGSTRDSSGAFNGHYLQINYLRILHRFYTQEVTKELAKKYFNTIVVSIGFEGETETVADYVRDGREFVKPLPELLKQFKEEQL